VNPSAELVAELQEALRAERGARTVYERLAGLVRDDVLAEVLAGFAEDELRQIEDVRRILVGLERAPDRPRLRRRLAALTLAYSAKLVGPRFALRVCTEAEETRSRWYAQFQAHFLECGAGEAAQACAQLCAVKIRHAQVLRTWVERL
jgi:rubrerythrin